MQDPSYTQMRIWLLTAEIHLRQGNVPEAELCAGEARLLAPLSYHLMHLRGQGGNSIAYVHFGDF